MRGAKLLAAKVFGAGASLFLFTSFISGRPIPRGQDNEILDMELNA
jgi:hypothetical protein